MPGAGEEGFSLLEVLIATVIMALVLVVLLQVLTAGARAREAVQNRTQAMIVADKILEEYCRAENLSAGRYQGQEGLFTYKVEIEPQYELIDARATSQVVCYLLHTTVFWKERGKIKSLGLQTIRTVARR